ncbi:MAG: hypothetical protein LBG19_09245 [Prevotellaceae bacterium]|jgi:hypothetical protein|nr:hypothetical protein [Prevotellaceae bacterium]
MQIQEQDLPIIRSWLRALASGEVVDASVLQQGYSVSPEQGERIRKMLETYESIDEWGHPTRNLAEQLRVDFYPKLCEKQKEQKEFMDIYGPNSSLRPYYRVNRWLWVILAVSSIVLAIRVLVR